MATYSLYLSIDGVANNYMYVRPDAQDAPDEVALELQGATIEQIVQHPSYQTAEHIHLSHVTFTPAAYTLPPNAGTVTIEYCNVPGPFVFPNAMDYLSIEGMTLAFPLVFPPTLLTLHLNACDLVGLPTLPNGLHHLTMNLMSIQGGFLTHLPTPLPAALASLTATTNGLEDLPPLPTQIQYIDVCENVLTILPTLPTQLRVLVIHTNRLTRLPPLPTSLDSLYAHTNQLTELPPLPARLTHFDVHQNQLRELPLPLPPRLQLRREYLEQNPWNPPFARLVERIPQIEAELGYGYHARDRTQEQIRKALQQYLQEYAREMGRNVSAARKTLPQAGIPATGALNIISSFLSGKSGSSKQQTLRLREEATRPHGGPGVQGGRRARPTRRKGRKGKRSSTR